MLVETIRRHTLEAADRSPADQPPAPDAAATVLHSQYADDADLSEVVEAFVVDLPQRLESMRAALKHGCLEDLKRLGHQLKGAGGSYGYPPLSEVAAVLERAAAGKDLEACTLAIGRLSSVCEAIRRGRAICPETGRPNP